MSNDNKFVEVFEGLDDALEGSKRIAYDRDAFEVGDLVVYVYTESYSLGINIDALREIGADEIRLCNGGDDDACVALEFYPQDAGEKET